MSTYETKTRQEYTDKYPTKAFTVRLRHEVHSAIKIMAKHLNVSQAILVGVICHDFINNFNERADGVRGLMATTSEKELIKALGELGFMSKDLAEQLIEQDK